MKIKSSATVIIISIAFLGFGVNAHAQTSGEQAEVSQLRTQVADLSALLQTLQASQEAAQSPCYVFESNLEIDADSCIKIKSLEETMKDEGLYDAIQTSTLPGENSVSD